jgi:hypothetical protein
VTWQASKQQGSAIWVQTLLLIQLACSRLSPFWLLGLGAYFDRKRTNLLKSFKDSAVEMNSLSLKLGDALDPASVLSRQ